MKPHEVLERALRDAAAAIGAPAGGRSFTLGPTRDPAHGDYATNLAMVLARELRQPPRAVAERLVQALAVPAGVVRKVEIAGAGFINFFMEGTQLASVLPEVLSRGADYGSGDAGRGTRVNVEFVSANPTGPLHVGHGRQAALGDAIAALLAWTGWNVTREFYYNDGGAQIDNLTLSVSARLRQLAGEHADMPEGGYFGEYVKEIAASYSGAPDDREAIRRHAVAAMRDEQDRDLMAFGVRFDVYALESSLYDEGKVEDTVRRWSAAGHTYEQDGALWLRTTAFGDDKDRVVKRSAERGGQYTYFVPDVAYHVTKWQRGFTRAINVQGADHHSTVQRVRIGLQALELGVPAGYPEYVLHQMVTVMKGGAEVKISKRAGSYMTVRELVDDVGRDAVRYFFLMRRGDAQFAFDVDLAKSQTDENPVFYVQMAHARLSGIFRVAGRDPASITADGADLALLDQPEEVELLKQLRSFPDVVARAAEALEPHRITGFLDALARIVHLWYHKYRVLGEPQELPRLVLARAARQVLANGLTLLGIQAPDRM